MNPDTGKRDYDRFRHYLEAHSGILLGDNKQYLVKSRIGRILQTHNIGCLRSLVDELERNNRSPLKQLVIDAMTTNETSWFRDTLPYSILKDLVLPQRAKASSQLRIWSAACSSGQEPYSISMVFEEWLKEQAGVKPSLHILATDLSLGIISAAQAGCYDELSLKRGLSTQRKHAFFKKIDDDCWQISRQIQQRVQFKPQNLLDSFQALGSYDAVFCRNVLIYFSPDVKRDILRRIHRVLKPGGYLFLGGSEAFTDSDLFTMVQCNSGIVYQAI